MSRVAGLSNSFLALFGTFSLGVATVLLVQNTLPRFETAASNSMVSKSRSNYIKGRVNSDLPGAIKALLSVFPSDRFSTDLELLKKQSSHLGSFHLHSVASVIVFPLDTEEVQKAVVIAKRFGVPIIPLGGRTALEGHFIPLPDSSCCSNSSGNNDSHSSPPRIDNRGSIFISLSRMNKVLAIHTQDQDCIVQPGLDWNKLNSYLEERDIPLFFPVDPGLGAHFGGMVAVAGSGTNAVRYGTMRAHRVLNLEVVLPDGTILRSHGSNRSRKTAMGWDVTRLFMGSEGTLGVSLHFGHRDSQLLPAFDKAPSLGQIITEITLKLEPILPSLAAVASFRTVEDAIESVIEIQERSMPMQCLEFLDPLMMRGLNLWGFRRPNGEKYTETPSLFLKIQVQNSGGDTSMNDLEKLVNKREGSSFVCARDEEESLKIWEARKGIYHCNKTIVVGGVEELGSAEAVTKKWEKEGWKIYITDCAVPISNFPNLVRRINELISESGLIVPVLGHAGDGNTHAAIMYREGVTEYSRVSSLGNKICELALELEGTVAGEHGVGLSKKHLMKRELGASTVDLMQKIKQLLDEDDIMNPGKLLPE